MILSRRHILLCTGLFALTILPATAATVSSCAADFSSCTVFENQVLDLPGLAISGDALLQDPITHAIIGDFRIFNDVFDSGDGTGLGVTAELFSNNPWTHINTLPNQFSANAVTIDFGGGPGLPNFIETDYNGNGTLYALFVQTPEPATFGLMGLGLFAVGIASGRRKRGSLRAS